MGGEYKVIEMHNSDNMQHTIEKLLPKIRKKILSIQKTNGICSLALAGGNTPKSLYSALSDEDIDWSNINITLTDERWVDVDHADSNENMLRTCFASSKSELNFISLKSSDSSVYSGEKITNKILSEKIPSLDVVILGMGEDGHFASIFPSVENYDALMDLKNTSRCLAVTPENKQARLSLTFRYLLSASVIYLLVSGEEKKKLLDRELDLNEISSEFPITALLNQSRCPVNIYWNP